MNSCWRSVGFLVFSCLVSVPRVNAAPQESTAPPSSSSSPAETQAAPPQDAEKVTLPADQPSTSLRTIFRDLVIDFKHMPSGVASYVAVSRLHKNVHFLSDVVFGAAVGTFAGRTVTRHGASSFTLVPLAVPRGGGLALIYSPKSQ